MTGSMLAGRGRRLVATVVDAIVVPIVVFFLMLVSGAFEHAEDYVGVRPLVSGLLLAVGGYLLPNGWLLFRRGQTLGKLATGIAIASVGSGDVPAFWRLMLRGLLFLFLPVIDVLFIFRGDRRCLHDLICGTRVVSTTAHALER